MRPEHDFTLKLEDWEMLVCRNATYFTAIKTLGQGKRIREEFKRLPDAIKRAKQLKGLVYAVTQSGRFCCLEEGKWVLYLDAWRELHAKPKGIREAAKKLKSGRK